MSTLFHWMWGWFLRRPAAPVAGVRGRGWFPVRRRLRRDIARRLRYEVEVPGR